MPRRERTLRKDRNGSQPVLVRYDHGREPLAWGSVIIIVTSILIMTIGACGIVEFASYRIMGGDIGAHFIIGILGLLTGILLAIIDE
jgi:hypothetical protein